jgi:pyridoxamine 5'-phosphate oxidase
MTTNQEDHSLRAELPTEPFGVLARWLEEVRVSGVPNPDAMCLATVTADGAPRARMVLCRSLDIAAGWIGFYTNRHSAKAHEIAGNAQATGVFHWETPFQRQAIVSGRVELAPDDDSDAYWATRPRLSQLSAWASEQSRPVASRAMLMAQLTTMTRRFGETEADGPIPRPSHWGGYRIVASRVELWVGSAGRLHDRAVYVRSGHGWTSMRLQP